MHIDKSNPANEYRVNIEPPDPISINTYQLCPARVPCRVGLMYFKTALQPAAGCADSAAGVRSGFNSIFTGVLLGGCWPHIAWGFAYGKKGFLPKTHKRFKEAQDDFHELHTCQTEGMWNVLVQMIGMIWGDKDPALNTLWHEKLVDPHNNWYIGYLASVPGATPSQQPQESWHNTGVMQVLRGGLRAGTVTCLEKSIPRIMKNDGITCIFEQYRAISNHISTKPISAIRTGY